jgi:hypothetical protein
VVVYVNEEAVGATGGGGAGSATGVRVGAGVGAREDVGWQNHSSATEITSGSHVAAAKLMLRVPSMK